MLTDFKVYNSSPTTSPKEGDVYKEVSVCGKTFKLVYGYYEDFERNSPYNDPMPIYPDFIKKPMYTDDGTPIVTAMQDVCSKYHGRREGDSCSECIFFKSQEELFGLCECPENKVLPNDKKNE